MPAPEARKELGGQEGESWQILVGTRDLVEAAQQVVVEQSSPKKGINRGTDIGFNKISWDSLGEEVCMFLQGTRKYMSIILKVNINSRKAGETFFTILLEEQHY